MNKLNLTYYLDSGSLLGAVRHGGLIPNDEDMDVVVPMNLNAQFFKKYHPKLYV